MTIDRPGLSAGKVYEQIEHFMFIILNYSILVLVENHNCKENFVYRDNKKGNVNLLFS